MAENYLVFSAELEFSRGYLVISMTNLAIQTELYLTRFVLRGVFQVNVSNLGHLYLSMRTCFRAQSPRYASWYLSWKASRL